MFTKRNQGDGFPTHPWVMGEFGHAVTKEIRAIAIVDNEIDWNATMWAGREHIELDAARPDKAMLSLMRELGEWKRNDGITLTAVVASVEAVELHWQRPDIFAVRYRALSRAKPGEWQQSPYIRRESAGLVISLPGIPTAEHLVELEVCCGQKKWRSTALQQSIPVELIEVGQ